MQIVVAQESVPPMMQATEVVHVAKMTARPVSRIELMTDGRMANCAMTQASVPRRAMVHTAVNNTRVPATDSTSHAAERVECVSGARRRGHYMTSTRMVHSRVADAAMNTPSMSAAKMSANADRMTATMPRTSDVRATNVASPEMSATEANVSSARVPA